MFAIAETRRASLDFVGSSLDSPADSRTGMHLLARTPDPGDESTERGVL